jgi:hypothetical protein
MDPVESLLGEFHTTLYWSSVFCAMDGSANMKKHAAILSAIPAEGPDLLSGYTSRTAILKNKLSLE